ncbi:sphingomyelin phosphodiesterase [Zalerion maritima]|uniref:Sphingomyelin phosphodiesterase n=1 Tax=Zalerion maritima TaxID=339359 RepID=A0AAD5WN36_9PEZI|nr:sphingomyelin phosphodiesterase [Zalerion maritima]
MRILPFLTVAAGVAAANPGTSLQLEERSVASDLWEKIEEATTCTACQAVLVVLKGLAHLGDHIFVSTLSGICKLTDLVDDDVCEGAIELEGPIIAHDLRHMSIGSDTSTLFCTTFLGLCDYPEVDEWDVPFPSPKPEGATRPSPSGEEPLKIVQFSDTHVDLFYTEGANTNCTKPICCRPYTTSDEPGNTDSPAGPHGDHNCDPPVSLEQSMFDAISTIVPDLSFAIFTGDIVDHAIWLTTEEQNTIDINDMYSRAASSIPLLFGTAGNHEQSPTNAFPTTAQNENSAEWIYSLLSEKWTQWIGSEAASTTAAQFGAYSTTFTPPSGNSTLRIISLNTNLYYVQNYWLYQKEMETDPSSQFTWLVSELQSAEDAGERVYIIGHMPMGAHDAFRNPSNYFDQILSRYGHVVSGMFFGHTHKDEFQVSYSSYGSSFADRKAEDATGVSWIAPSLTPTDGHPAFRVYTVDPATWMVLDAETYAADMSSPAFQAEGPVWLKYYGAREAYGALVQPPRPPAGGSGAREGAAAVGELGPAFWHGVTEAFLLSPNEALAGYVERKTRGYSPETCEDQECVDSTVCMLRGGRAQDNCFEPELGQQIFKRGLDGNGERREVHRDSCGVGVAREVLGMLKGRRDLREEVIRRAVDEGATLRRL